MTAPDKNPPPDRWELYERFAPAIRAYAARRVERDAVDDIVADTFAIAWRRLPREGDPLPWLYGVARRVVHGHRRSHARRGALLHKLRGRAAGAPPDPADLVVGDPALAAAFATLSERDREAIRLVAWEALDNAAAARAAGCSPSTFAVRLSRARNRLRAALDAPEDAAPSPGAAPTAVSAPFPAPLPRAAPTAVSQPFPALSPRPAPSAPNATATRALPTPELP